MLFKGPFETKVVQTTHHLHDSKPKTLNSKLWTVGPFKKALLRAVLGGPHFDGLVFHAYVGVLCVQPNLVVAMLPK